MKQFYRQATSEELDFYEQKLYPLQDEVFKVASVYGEKIYLVGGTALARFHFGHRLSEDLDFFTITDDLQPIAVDLIARLRNKGFSLEIDKLELYFARFYVLKEDYALKVEFAREYHLIGDLVKTEEGIFCDNLDDLGTNKITARKRPPPPAPPPNTRGGERSVLPSPSIGGGAGGGGRPHYRPVLHHPTNPLRAFV